MRGFYEICSCGGPVRQATDVNIKLDKVGAGRSSERRGRISEKFLKMYAWWWNRLKLLTFASRPMKGGRICYMTARHTRRSRHHTKDLWKHHVEHRLSSSRLGSGVGHNKTLVPIHENPRRHCIYVWNDSSWDRHVRRVLAVCITALSITISSCSSFQRRFAVGGTSTVGPSIATAALSFCESGRRRTRDEAQVPRQFS